MSNRLANEKSPYLLQHKDNPVDWYPWGEEAFEAAKRLDRPLFVSIGYATCHWCHVMERESFEDPDVARLMNGAFVSVKIDREERPDLDAAFMAVCQAGGGSCGWPLTVIITPDRKPFLVTTYLPKESVPGRIGMLDLVPRISQMWITDRDGIEERANQIEEFVASSQQFEATRLSDACVDNAVHDLAASFDRLNGGFGGAPKFPSPHVLVFLIRHAARGNVAEALSMARLTLRQMRRGGIFDQVGYGFHRYSTDSEWILPHFEKMLYDQATHMSALTEAWAATRDEEFRHTIAELSVYLSERLAAPSGAFYSAEDADSEGEEGRYYVWSLAELEEVLGNDAAAFARAFRCTASGNFLDEATRRRTGTNVLHRGSKDEYAVPEHLAGALSRLKQARSRRVPPLLDDKILCDWNGLMIASLADAGWRLDDKALLHQAEKAYRSVSLLLGTDDGKLLHRYRDGDAAIPALLDDYACMIRASLSLYRATGRVSYLQEALRLQSVQDDAFLDRDSGGYFMTTVASTEVLTRQKEFVDGAYPSGNSISAGNLVWLHRLTGSADFRDTALRTMTAVARFIERSPSSFASMLDSYDELLHPAAEVVIVAGTAADAEPARDLIRSRFTPGVTVHVLTEENRDDLELLAPFVSGMSRLGSRPTYYICTDFSCRAPTTSLDELASALKHTF